MSSSTTERIIPLSALRTLALHTQELTAPLDQTPRPDANRLYAVIEKLGCLQIDTLQMVQRSHYLALWSRVGSYDTADLDRLAYDGQNRKLFEYWKHAACLIPLTQFRYSLPQMRWFGDGRSRWYQNWLDQPDTPELIAAVLERIREQGAQKVSDFEYNGERRGAWWDWKPAKQALEHLYNSGELMIAERVNFQRVYDLRHRVLPEWVDLSEPTWEERNRFLVEEAGRALGVFQAAQAAEYAYLKRGEAAPVVEGLLKAGVFVSIQGELMDGSTAELVVHRNNLPSLEQVVDGQIRTQRTTFLSPFDSLFWARGRDEAFWNFRQVLEAYKPQKDRIWGYFCLPILHRDRLVGRFDPKLDRKAGRLHLKALYLEDGVDPDEELVAGVAAAMRDFLVFHEADEVVIERSKPAVFGEKLLKAL